MEWLRIRCKRVYIYKAEIVLIKPLYPQVLGGFLSGGHPQTPGRKYPAPLFHHSLYIQIYGLAEFGSLKNSQYNNEALAVDHKIVSTRSVARVILR